MSIDVTDDLVAKIATLSRLSLSPEEAAEVKNHFRKILLYVEELQQLDLQGVDPSLFSLDASNVQRDDEPKASLPLADVLANAPEAKSPFFVVPRIVAEASDAGSGGAGQ